MSRRGNPYDNAMAENFFSILKTECIYRTKLQTYEDARILIDEYIHFYNHQASSWKQNWHRWKSDVSLLLKIQYLLPFRLFLYCPYNLGQFKI